jgi:hypothetical protein
LDGESDSESVVEIEARSTPISGGGKQLPKSRGKPTFQLTPKTPTPRGPVNCSSEPKPKRARVERKERSHSVNLTENYTGGNALYPLLSLGAYFELEDLSSQIRREKARSLPGTMTSDVDKKLILKSVEQWESCAERYLEEIVSAIRETLRGLCDHHFGGQKHSGLYTDVWYGYTYIATNV